MAHRRSAKISTFGSQVTSIISVALVLLIIGLIAMGGMAARNLTDDIRSNLGFTVRMNHESTPDDANALKRVFNEAPYVSAYVYSSPEDIFAAESEYLGEDLSALIDNNPYAAEFDVRVKPGYASTDSINAIKLAVEALPQVEEVITETSIIDSVNSAISRVTVVLLAVAGALMVISFVLINNTVSLSVYSRRFVIHTMKLVGATRGFIRKPFVRAGAWAGVASAVIATAVLCALLVYIANADPVLARLLSWADMAIVALGLLALGVLICTLASLLATNRYLSAQYDDMFMK